MLLVIFPSNSNISTEKEAPKCNNTDNISKFLISFPKNQLPETPI